MKQIELGALVRDKITGFEGTAMTRATWMYGCNTYDVQPKIDKDGKVPDQVAFDEPQLEVIEESSSDMELPEEPETIVELGSKVKDPVSGTEGTVTARCFFLNGCVRVCVQPKQMPGKQEIKNIWIPEQQAEIIVKSEPVKAKHKVGGPQMSTSIDRSTS